MDWLPIVAVVVVGLMVGVELRSRSSSTRSSTGCPRTPGCSPVSDGERMLGRRMPFWYFGSLLLTAATAVLRSESAAAAWTAAALLVVSVIMSIALLVPVNERSKAWIPATAPADWREQLARWDRLHVVASPSSSPCTAV